MQKTKIIQLISVSLLLLTGLTAQAETSNQSDIQTTYTSLNRCPVTDRHTFKREKSISEQCEAKEDFTIFIEGDSEETLKFVLEKEFKQLIADDPHARRIRISNISGGDDYLSGEISGQRVEWVYRKDQLIGIVLKRLINDRKQYEAFRLVNDSHFCHLGGDVASETARKLLENGKQCNA
jgi:hypothetical protein